MAELDENPRYAGVSNADLKAWVKQIKENKLFDHILEQLQRHIENQMRSVIYPENEYQTSCELLGMHTLKVASYCDGVRYVKGILNDIESEQQRRVDDATRRAANDAKRKRHGPYRQTTEYGGESHTGVRRDLKASDLGQTLDSLRKYLRES